MDPATGEQRCAPLWRADPRSKLAAGPLQAALKTRAAEHGVEDLEHLAGSKALKDDVRSVQEACRLGGAKRVKVETVERVCRKVLGADPRELYREGFDQAWQHRGKRVNARVQAFDHCFSSPKSVSLLAATVVDDMGDPDGALGLAAEAPIDKTKNRHSGTVAAAPAVGIDVWDDVQQSGIDHCSQATWASDLAWRDRNIAYRSELPGLAFSPTDELALRVAARFDADAGGAPDETWNLAGLDVDLLVELERPTGSATVRLGASSPVPYPLPGRTVLSVPRTVRLPLDAFTAVSSTFDPGSITAVTVRPAGGATGRILIDDIEVAR